MAKVNVIHDINMRVFHEGQNRVIYIPKDSLINVTDSMAIQLCNEDIEAMSIEEQKKNSRIKHAVRTGFFSADNLLKTHEDYTWLG